MEERVADLDDDEPHHQTDDGQQRNERRPPTERHHGSDEEAAPEDEETHHGPPWCDQASGEIEPQERHESRETYPPRRPRSRTHTATVAWSGATRQDGYVTSGTGHALGQRSRSFGRTSRANSSKNLAWSSPGPWKTSSVKPSST
jgi:hypothetical protein